MLHLTQRAEKAWEKMGYRFASALSGRFLYIRSPRSQYENPWRIGLRKVGSLENTERAEIFRWYLLGKGIETQIEDEPLATSDVWIIHDRQLQAARDLLNQFESSTDIEPFRKHLTEGQKNRKDQEGLAKKKTPSSAKTITPSHNGTFGLIACSIIFFLLHYIDRDQWLLRHLTISEDFVANSLGIKSFHEILSGQVWRLLSPIFIHKDIFHIAFNMIWLYQFGKLIEYHIGTKSFLLLVAVTAIPSNIAFYLVSGPLFGGMSGVIYGLFYFMWVYDYFKPGSPFHVDPYLFKFFTGFYVLCWLLSAMGFPVANTIHGVGGLSGLIAGYIASGQLRFLRRQLKLNKNAMYNILIVLSLVPGGIITDILIR